MDAVLQAIGSWPGAVALRDSWVLYLFVNAAHILGIGLLLGGILPLDLRLLGLFRSISLPVAGPVLHRIAMIGFAIAAPMGLCLFSVKPGEYIQNEAFLFKVGLLVLALLNIAFQHSGRDFRIALEGGEVAARVRVSAFISFSVWLCVLVAGRWIGFI